MSDDGATLEWASLLFQCIISDGWEALAGEPGGEREAPGKLPAELAVKNEGGQSKSPDIYSVKVCMISSDDPRPSLARLRACPTERRREEVSFSAPGLRGQTACSPSLQGWRR